MKLVWGPVRKLGRLYGLMWGPWFVGVGKRFDPGIILEGRE